MRHFCGIFYFYMQNCTNLPLLLPPPLDDSCKHTRHSRLKKKLKIPHCIARISFPSRNDLWSSVAYSINVCHISPNSCLLNLMMALKTSNKTIEFIFKSILSLFFSSYFFFFFFLITEWTLFGLIVVDGERRRRMTIRCA